MGNFKEAIALLATVLFFGFTQIILAEPTNTNWLKNKHGHTILIAEIDSQSILNTAAAKYITVKVVMKNISNEDVLLAFYNGVPKIYIFPVAKVGEKSAEINFSLLSGVVQSKSVLLPAGQSFAAKLQMPIKMIKKTIIDL